MKASIAVDVGFEVEESSAAWSGDGPTYYVARSQTASSEDGFPGPDRVDGVSVLTIVEDGDGYLVARHAWFGPTD